MIKKLSLLATFLLIIGIVGVLFTFSNKNSEPQMLEEKTIDTNEFQHIKIMSNNGNVNIVPTKENNASITLYGNDTSSALTTNVEEDTLHIELKTNRKKLFSFDFFPNSLELTVYLPRETYEKIHATSSNGKITMQQLSATDIQLISQNGRISADQLQSDHMLLQTNNGKIEAAEMESQIIEVNSDNGRINLDDIEAEIMAETNNGKISLDATHVNHPINMHSDNGKIEMKTDNKPDNVIYDLKTKNGNITVFGEKDWDTKVGSGDYLLKLSTHHGNITITNE